MKQIGYAFFCIVFFFLMLCFPRQTLAGATDGLLLWFQIVLPTLLPFFIITNLLIQTNSILYAVKLFGPILQRIFRVSQDGSFAVLSGFLCGYPIGAKVTADLVRTNRISVQEGNYLLSFCNQTSPAFISSYIVMQQLGDTYYLLPTFVILYVSAFICSLIFRRFYHISEKTTFVIQKRDDKIHFNFRIFDNCIMNAFENITKVGGYIILFSILFSLGRSIPFNGFFAVLEITNGIPHLLSQGLPFALTYIFILSLTSFGGICSIAQTAAMLGGTKLSVSSYTIKKLITAMITSLFALLYVILLHPLR